MLQEIQLNVVEREPRVDSRLIAARLGTDHRSTFRLLSKFKAEFETLGKVRFEIAPSASGQQQRFAFLNEDQAVFLLTLTRNTEKVVALKLALTKAFKRARDDALRLRQLQLDPEWMRARQEGKTMRRAASEAIDAFVTYAKAQGSTHAHRYFVTITRMTCRALFTFEPGQEKRMGPTVRDHLDASQLAALAVVEDTVVKVLHAGMGEGWPYKTVYLEARKRAHAVATVLGKSPVRASALPASEPASGKRPQPRAAVQLPLWESRMRRS